MKTILYYFLKIYIKSGLYFYSKKISVSGIENIPKNEAVLFTSNHPNGLVDPLHIATQINRKTHFLVRAGVFKKPLIAKFFDLLGMMPVYRIRDGINQLSKNEAIFNQCENILKNKKALLIFPEGSHCKDRFIRPLSKGFTRIVFRTINNNPSIKIHIVPIGITYQNASKYPSKVAINFGTPIIANQFYDTNDTNTSIKKLKELISHQLKELSVHIENNDAYQPTLQKLNKAQVDFTNVASVNSIIKSEEYPKEKMRSKNYASLLYYFVIINSFIPYSIWKFLSKKVTELEFVDTFRFGVNVVVFPLFYSLQSWIIYFLFGYKISFVYFISSLILVLLYSKLSTTPPLK